jgi:hypothetical protein
MDGKLGFQLSDAPPRRRQLSPLRGREPGFDPLVPSLLSPPAAIHRLVAESEVARDVTHPSASRDQVKDTLAKLRWIAPSADSVLLLGQQHGSPIFRLHKTQGSRLRLTFVSGRGRSSERSSVRAVDDTRRDDRICPQTAIDHLLVDHRIRGQRSTTLRLDPVSGDYPRKGYGLCAPLLTPSIGACDERPQHALIIYRSDCYRVKRSE